LQEALDALWQARDQERAEAIQRVFLGLAMNPVKDSLAQVEQLQIVRLAAEMTTWEVTLCNALERYSNLVFDLKTANAYAEASHDGRTNIRSHAFKNGPQFEQWLKREYCGDKSARFEYLSEAIQSLWRKRLFKYDRSWNEITADARCLRQGAFTDFGWQLAQHLYSAEVPTEAEAE
jgi:hypothetical protein